MKILGVLFAVLAFNPALSRADSVTETGVSSGPCGANVATTDEAERNAYSQALDYCWSSHADRASPYEYTDVCTDGVQTITATAEFWCTE